MSHSVSHLPFRAGCAHCVKGLARDWPHHSDSGLTPAVHMVAQDFFVGDTKSDDALAILAMKEKPYQSDCATVVHEVTIDHELLVFTEVQVTNGRCHCKLSR